MYGTVLGQAIGDAMGSQTEFNKHKVVELGPTWGYNFPAFSDDTQMAISIAEALLSYLPDPKTPTLHEFDMAMINVAENFVRWDNGAWGSNNRSPGGCCLAGVRRIRNTSPLEWQRTGDLNGKGNGGVMRASFVGCYFWQNPIAAFQFGALTSVPTHNNLESLLASGGIAYLVAQAINGMPLPKAVMNLLGLIWKWETSLPVGADRPHYAAEVLFAATRIGQALAAAKQLDVAAFKSFNGHDGKAVEALAAAIHANARFSNYGDIIRSLANDTGDSDSTAAIGGALAGARFGYGFIPKQWRDKVETSAYLHGLAERLWLAPKNSRLREPRRSPRPKRLIP